MSFLLKIVGFLPSWAWASVVAGLLVVLGWREVSLASTRSDLAKAESALSVYKYEQSEADKKALVRLLDRNITLSGDIGILREKEVQNARELQIARDKLAKYTNGVQQPTSAANLERDFRAAGYERASAYASGVEGIYRSCAKEYIDLGIGIGGAAEASKAAYAQKGRADAIEKALKPIPPIPPTPPIK